MVLGFGLSLIACAEDSDKRISSQDKEPKAKELYITHCASCHGDRGDLGVSGAKNLLKSSLNIDSIKAIIRNGKNGMPPFEGIIEKEQHLDSLAQYVNSMQK
ncbi:MAG: c-type cytochrome [Bacteroidota bacterium]